MRLTSIQVDGFRGIGHVLLNLDRTTVLLGENRVGKTTIVDAIDYCLGARPATSSPFVASDLRRGDDLEPAPHIHLILVWAETAVGEWDAPAFQFMTPLVQPAGEDDVRQVSLRLSGVPGEDGIESAWDFLDGVGQPLAAGTLEQVEALRRLSPCLLLSADRYQVAREKTLPPSSATEAKRVVETVYRRVCKTRGGLSLNEIRAGLDAARELRDQTYSRTDSSDEESRDVQDMIDTPRSLAPLLEGLDEEDSLSSQNLALLILVGSLLQALGDEALPPEASPVVVIEEPETSLHPILAAGLWGTLEGLSAQQVITTHSGDLLASAPLKALRRLVRPAHETLVHQLAPRALSQDDQRRVSYHVRIRRGASLFARCWLLVEGETEAWLIPEVARLCGYVLPSEGVYCLEFAQCGVRPLFRLANAMGIQWHLLADGDDAGQSYVRMAQRGLNGRPLEERITGLGEPDVEHLLWAHGYSRVFHEAAYPSGRRQGRKSKQGKRARRKARRRGHSAAKGVIEKAIKNHSKPFMALRALEAMSEPGSPGVPPALRRAIEAAVWLARRSAGVPTRRPQTLRHERPEAD